MDPLTLSLIAAGGQAISALPDIIPSEHERTQKKELEKLPIVTGKHRRRRNKTRN